MKYTLAFIKFKFQISENINQNFYMPKYKNTILRNYQSHEILFSPSRLFNHNVKLEVRITQYKIHNPANLR